MRQPPAHPHPHPHASEHGGCEEPHTCHPTPRVPRPLPHPHAFAPAHAHPCGTLGFPRVIACARDPSNLSHHSDRGGSLVRVHQFTALVLWCPEVKKALAFPTNSFSFSSSRTRRRRAVISASISRESGRRSRTAWRRSRSSVTPAHHRFTQPSIPSHRRDRRPRIQHQSRNITTILRHKRRRVPITGTSLAAGTRTRFTKC